MPEITLQLFDKQIDFLESEERSVLLQSGIGFGKSFIGALWVILTALKYPGKKGLIVARDFPQLKIATLEEIKKVFNILEMVEGVDYKWNKSNNDIVFPNKTILYCRGANNYDSAFRGGNIAFILADEGDYYKPAAWRTLKGRLRIHPELMRVVSSPNGYNHIWEDFFQNSNETTKVIEATTYDNPTLSDEYIEDLKRTYSPRLFEQEVLAKRLRLNVGAVYSEFKREKHVKNLDELIDKIIKERLEIYFFTDYNIANYCGVYLYFDGTTVYCIGEEHLQYKGSAFMAQVVRARFPDNPIIVCGDSTGNNKKDVAIDRTNYAHFEAAGLMTKRFRNPPVHSRIISANSNMYHGKAIFHEGTEKHKGCPTLIKDLELVAWQENGSDIDKSDINLSHASDAYTYGLWHHLPLIIRKKSTSYQG